MSNKKTPRQLRNQAIEQGREYYAYPLTLGNILELEKQIQDGRSLWISTVSHSYTAHLVQLDGMVIVVIYDKRRNCLDSILPYSIVKTWVNQRVVNEYVFREWRRKWVN